MIEPQYQLLIAVGLDLALGDPRWAPHPVRIIGRLAMALENPSRRLFRHQRLAGAMLALTVIGASGTAAWAAVQGATRLHPLAGDVVSILLIAACLAARDLATHAAAVYRPLKDGDLDQARRSLAMIVGRDTERLDESGVARAAVESVAENLVDGVTAPLLFAAVFGPVGAIVYKAINTLDSTFGYKNERYARFGWAPARIDDAANYLPARLTGPFVVAAAFLLRQRALHAARILLRDRRRHVSPNAGYPEAAFAGALGVQLGGPAHYFGSDRPVDKPTIGDSSTPLRAAHIGKATALMYATAGLCTLACVAAQAAAGLLWRQGGWPT